MTSKKIITNRLTVSNSKLSKKLIEYNEDSNNKNGISLGLSISMVKSNTAKSSGVKHVFFPALLDNHYQTLLSGSSHVQILNLESKSSQGISIKNFSDTTGDNLPFVYMGNTSPYPDSFDERFAPFLKFSELGVIENIKKEDMFLVYDDTVNEYDHKNYINKQQNERGSIYPTISGSRYSSIFEINSTIEPFEIRNQLFKTTAGNTLKNSEDNKYRNFFSGITVDIVGPHVMRKHGSNIVITDRIDKLELNLTNNSPYNDTNQKEPIQNDLKPIDYDGEYVYTFKPYDELRAATYLDNMYDFASQITSMNDLIFGCNIEPPYIDISEIGSRYTSSTVGFIHEKMNSKQATDSGIINILGTDSIAFNIGA